MVPWHAARQRTIRTSIYVPDRTRFPSQYDATKSTLQAEVGRAFGQEVSLTSLDSLQRRAQTSRASRRFYEHIQPDMDWGGLMARSNHTDRRFRDETSVSSNIRLVGSAEAQNPCHNRRPGIPKHSFHETVQLRPVHFATIVHYGNRQPLTLRTRILLKFAPNSTMY